MDNETYRPTPGDGADPARLYFVVCGESVYGKGTTSKDDAHTDARAHRDFTGHLPLVVGVPIDYSAGTV